MPPYTYTHRPAEQYAPWYATVLKAAQVAVSILGMLEEETRASKLSFADIARRLAELPEAAPAFVAKKVGWQRVGSCVVEGIPLGCAVVENEDGEAQEGS